MITISKEAAVTFARIGRYLILCGLENIHVLSVFRHDYKVVLILSWSYQWVLGIVLDIRGCFSLLNYTTTGTNTCVWISILTKQGDRWHSHSSNCYKNYCPWGPEQVFQHPLPWCGFMASSLICVIKGKCPVEDKDYSLRMLWSFILGVPLLLIQLVNIY